MKMELFNDTETGQLAVEKSYNQYFFHELNCIMCQKYGSDYDHRLVIEIAEVKVTDW